MNFVGEHLLPGQIGHFAAILAFVASLVATVAYYCAVVNKEEPVRESWKKIARWGFFIQSIAVLAVFSCLYYILYNHFFEYKYAWRNTSRDLPIQYLLSSLWSDQEGSFLLWSIWNSVLGIILIRTSRKWESPVMTVISLSQLMMSSMLLGIFILGYKVGSNPFMLLRQAEENQVAPIFQSPDYLSFIHDGNGLNLTLQNYWMVIHPPVLFLGFASMIVPFAFAFAGIWTRDYTGWTKPVLPWGLFAVAVLGLGIMMGAAWAYESLNFGGYWAWDPVENASLVPWILMVAGVHTCLAYKSTGHALKSTVFFFFMAFITVLYSTFLTRSGVLGDSSVHSFTDLGMSGQLLIFMGAFTIPAIWLMIARRKQIPALHKEESTYSREFWLFVGSLVLLISAIQITFTTSIPVWNKLLDLFGLKKLFNLDEMAPPSDAMFHYNKIQIWLAVILGLLTAVVQYMRYKDTPRRVLGKKLLVPTALSLVITLAIIFAGGVNYTDYGAGFLGAIYLMLFATVYAVVANVLYIITEQKGKIKAAGASIAHVGFGMVLLGALLSSSRKEVISLDKMKMLSQDIFRKESKQNARENIMLPRGVPVEMGEYHATFVGDSIAPGDAKVYFKVDYERKDKAGKIVERFRLYPNAFVNSKENALTSNPASRHYLHKDIFTYITATPPLKDRTTPANDTANYTTHVVAEGDSIFFSKGFMIMRGIAKDPTNKNYQPRQGDLAVGADLEVYTQTDDHFNLQPVYLIRDSAYQYSIEDTLAPLALQVRFSKILPAENKIEIKVKEADENSDYIIMKAIVFPYINVLWLGVIVMIVGTLIAVVYRVKLNKGSVKATAARVKEKV